MNNLFNQISSIDRRLLIYTYNNRYIKNNSFIANNYNYNNLKKSIFTVRPGTPNYSIRANQYKDELMNKNFTYEYNYFDKDLIKRMNINNKDNKIGFPNSLIQKNVNEYLYGNNKYYNY